MKREVDFNTLPMPSIPNYIYTYMYDNKTMFTSICFFRIIEQLKAVPCVNYFTFESLRKSHFKLRGRCNMCYNVDP